jgi:hypothetical protein
MKLKIESVINRLPFFTRILNICIIICFRVRADSVHENSSVYEITANKYTVPVLYCKTMPFLRTAEI